MEVAFMKTVIIYSHTFLNLLLHFQITMNDQGSLWLNQGCIMTEAFQICFFRSVNVKMVWVCRCDDCHPRAQPMEGTVKLIGFNHDKITDVRKNVVCSVILGNATQESVAINMALVHEMCAHGRSGSLSMRSCYAKSFVRTCQRSQYLSTFLYLKAILLEKN